MAWLRFFPSNLDTLDHNCNTSGFNWAPYFWFPGRYKHLDSNCRSSCSSSNPSNQLTMALRVIKPNDNFIICPSLLQIICCSAVKLVICCISVQFIHFFGLCCFFPAMQRSEKSQQQRRRKSYRVLKRKSGAKDLRCRWNIRLEHPPQTHHVTVVKFH